jgi:hypothetical protein
MREPEIDQVAGGEPSEPATEGPTRRRRRWRRTGARARTVPIKKLTRAVLQLGAVMSPPVDLAPGERPRVRGDCSAGERPCPWVSCKHHLYLDVIPESGSIKLNFPDLEPWELAETCALDVAARGGETLEEVGGLLNITRERIRQVEVRALLKLRMGSPSEAEVGANLLRPPPSPPPAPRAPRRSELTPIAEVDAALLAEPGIGNKRHARRLHVHPKLVRRRRAELGLPPATNGRPRAAGKGT